MKRPIYSTSPTHKYGLNKPGCGQTHGGHAVPAERILARYHRTLENLTRAVRLADVAVLYDAADVAPGAHALVAMCKRDWTQEKVSPLPPLGAAGAHLTHPRRQRGTVTDPT